MLARSECDNYKRGICKYYKKKHMHGSRQEQWTRLVGAVYALGGCQGEGAGEKSAGAKGLGGQGRVRNWMGFVIRWRCGEAMGMGKVAGDGDVVAA